MRRWPWSMKTMNTSNMSETTMMIPNLALPPSSKMALNPVGMAATTLAKIRIDMPWPMPRWVISSASHMTMAVPAVRISTMKRASGQLKVGIRSMLVPSSAESCPWKA